MTGWLTKAIFSFRRVTPGSSGSGFFASFKAVVEGEYDHLPEQAFYMVGGIEDVVKKAAELAEDA